MNDYFTKLWSDFPKNTPSGQKQVEELAQWINQGLKGFEDMSAFFLKSCGMEQAEERGPDYLFIWKKVQEEFTKSFKSYLTLFGIMTRNEYLEFLRKYEELKEKAASQAETIKHLRLLLSEAKDTTRLESSRQLDGVLKKQSEQFQRLMDGFSDVFKKGQAAEAKEQPEV